MYNGKILDIFLNPPFLGILKKADLDIELCNEEGKVVRLTANIENNIIVEANFKALGDINFVVCCSLFTKSIINKSLSDATSFDYNVLAKNLDNLDSKDFLLIFEALRKGIRKYIKKQSKK